MNSTLKQLIDLAESEPISEARKSTLLPLIEYIQNKVSKRKPVYLNFICTHNSRRSQFSQIWAQVAAAQHGLQVYCYSGGVEVTAFNPRAAASAERFGFEISKEGNDNPCYQLKFSDEYPPINAFSKLFDSESNPKQDFAAVMTCSHADENCPFIPGTELRISLTYEDPKKFDDTILESSMYDARSIQIASEMFHVFSQIKL